MGTFGEIFDKYGPLGAAVFILGLTILLLVYKVIPTITEIHGKRLDALIAAFRDSVGMVDTRLQHSEQEAKDRHDALLEKSEEHHAAIMDKLASIHEKLPRRSA